MKKNYIKPSSISFELEAEELLLSISKEEGPAKTSLGMGSKDRSGYAHEDLGWDY